MSHYNYDTAWVLLLQNLSNCNIRRWVGFRKTIGSVEEHTKKGKYTYKLIRIVFQETQKHWNVEHTQTYSKTAAERQRRRFQKTWKPIFRCTRLCQMSLTKPYVIYRLKQTKLIVSVCSINDNLVGNVFGEQIVELLSSAYLFGLELRNLTSV